MNDNIKKEVDIIEDYLKKYQYYIDKDEMPPEIEKEVTEKKDTLWIKASWLKEQIETKQKRINLSGDNKFKAIYNNALDWMFMLLKKE